MNREQEAMACYQARNVGSDLRVCLLTVAVMLVAAIALAAR
jgi:hypothetical protein